jgi:hypothetical protein
MSFFKKITASGNINVMERTDIDTEIEKNINTIGINKFGDSDYGDLYLRIDELGGFLILETILISATNFKSKKGSKLTFIKENETLEFESDENKIESDFSSSTNRAVTKIDYNISSEEADAFKEAKYDKVRFQINGKEILFSVLK